MKILTDLSPDCKITAETIIALTDPSALKSKKYCCKESGGKKTEQIMRVLSESKYKKKTNFSPENS